MEYRTHTGRVPLSGSALGSNQPYVERTCCTASCREPSFNESTCTCLHQPLLPPGIPHVARAVDSTRFAPGVRRCGPAEPGC